MSPINIEPNRFTMTKTRKEIAQHLGISTTTLWRKLKEGDVQIRSGLIYPEDEKRILHFFGITDEPLIKSTSGRRDNHLLKR